MEVEICERRPEPGARWTLAFILRPADKRGEGYLSKTKAQQPADRHAYFMATKRPRRISLSAAPSFVGAALDAQEFELLQEAELWTAADVAATLRAESTVEGVQTHVLELTPRRPDARYHRFTAWLGTDDLVLRQLDWFDADGLRKRLRQSDVRTVGGIPVAHRIVIETFGGTQIRTRIEIQDVQFDIGLNDTRFTGDALRLGHCR
jgi:hypothetical protein